jgi:hypothetical protein
MRRGEDIVSIAFPQEIEPLKDFGPGVQFMVKIKGADRVKADLSVPVHDDSTEFDFQKFQKSIQLYNAVEQQQLPNNQKEEEKGEDQMKSVLSDLTEREYLYLKFAMQNISSLQFDTIFVDTLTHGNALLVVGFVIFQRHGLLQRFNIPIPTFMNFLWLFQHSYKDVRVNPMHIFFFTILCIFFL